eukprot:scaffold59525_cov54-Phaeocystis_antarctica.AAC.1
MSCHSGIRAFRPTVGHVGRFGHSGHVGPRRAIPAFGHSGHAFTATARRQRWFRGRSGGAEARGRRRCGAW